MAQHNLADSLDRRPVDMTSGHRFEREGELKDFEAWKVCWEVNLAFYEPLEGGLTCLVCQKVNSYGQGTNRSEIWMATRCGSGHGQGNIPVHPGTTLGVCAKCDLYFLLNVLNGKYTCRREGCRRLIRVHETAVRKRLDKSQQPVSLGGGYPKLFRRRRGTTATTATATERPITKSFFALLEESKVFECTVCCEDIPFKEDIPPAPTCQHDQNVCNNCMRADFERKVNTNRLKELRCPDPECRQDVPPKRIRELLAGSDALKV